MTTYYVDGAVGSDLNDGLAEGAGNAWATLQKAADTVTVAGDTIYVKNSAAYNEQLLLRFRGDATNRILWEGYSSTPGDGGKVIVDGQSTRAYCVETNISFDQLWFVFKNFIFRNATSHGINLGAKWATVFHNCEFLNNGGTGCATNRQSLYLDCVSANNGDDGFSIAVDGYAVGCIAYNNVGTQISLSSDCVAYKCLAYGIAGSDIEAGIRAQIILACTSDGENVANSVGLFINNVAGLIGDCIAYDCQKGIKLSPSSWPLVYAGYNLLNSNVLNYDSTSQHAGVYFQNDVYGAPGFNDEASGDYTLSDTSAALNAGIKPGAAT